MYLYRVPARSILITLGFIRVTGTRRGGENYREKGVLSSAPDPIDNGTSTSFVSDENKPGG